MPMEEDESSIRLTGDKTLVCEVNARTVVISGQGKEALVLKRKTLAQASPGDDSLLVEGKRFVKTGGEESDHAGNVVIRVKGDYTLHVTGNLVIQADGDLQLKSGKDLSLSAMNARVDARGQLSQKATSVDIEGRATGKIKAGNMLDIKADGMLDIKGGMIKIN